MKLNLFFAILLICNCSLSQKINASIDITEMMYNSTIKIQATRDTNISGKTFKVTGYGTGFFFAFAKDSGNIPVIVTNAHVVRGFRDGTLNFNSRSNNSINYGDNLSINLRNFESLWLFHPTEDLAFLPLMPLVNAIVDKYKKTPIFIPFTENTIPKLFSDFTALEEVLMIGYPKGLSDSANNLPVIRKGITATPIYIDYNKKPWYLLDIPIYGGSSGSPIVIYNDVGRGYTDKKTGGTNFGVRFYLVGIACQSQNYYARGETISKDPKLQMLTETLLPFEIAIAIKSTAILDLKPILLKAIDSKAYERKLYQGIY